MVIGLKVKGIQKLKIEPPRGPCPTLRGASPLDPTDSFYVQVKKLINGEVNVENWDKVDRGEHDLEGLEGEGKKKV